LTVLARGDEAAGSLTVPAGAGRGVVRGNVVVFEGDDESGYSAGATTSHRPMVATMDVRGCTGIALLA
jgi:hypothetical protein